MNKKRILIISLTLVLILTLLMPSAALAKHDRCKPRSAATAFSGSGLIYVAGYEDLIIEGDIWRYYGEVVHEKIPCNPCEAVCKRSIITVGQPITNYPKLIDPKGECTGCSRCMVICPGLAIFIVDKTFSETEASVSVPYEQLPLPEEGEMKKPSFAYLAETLLP